MAIPQAVINQCHATGRLRSPVIEVKNHAIRYYKFNRSTAFDVMRARIDRTRLANRVRPGLTVNKDRPAPASIIVIDGKIGAAVRGCLRRAPQMAVIACRERNANQYQAETSQMPRGWGARMQRCMPVLRETRTFTSPLPAFQVKLAHSVSLPQSRRRRGTALGPRAP